MCTVELLAINIAVNWIEKRKEQSKVLICSDSSSGLVSIQNIHSDTRQDIILEIAHTVLLIKKVSEMSHQRHQGRCYSI